jgi:hypothetical protein
MTGYTHAVGGAAAGLALAAALATPGIPLLLLALDPWVGLPILALEALVGYSWASYTARERAGVAHPQVDPRLHHRETMPRLAPGLDRLASYIPEVIPRRGFGAAANAALTTGMVVPWGIGFLASKVYGAVYSLAQSRSAR